MIFHRRFLVHPAEEAVKKIQECGRGKYCLCIWENDKLRERLGQVENGAPTKTKKNRG